MKHARDLQPLTAHQRLLQQYDLREIDAPEPRDLFCLKYLARLEAVTRAARRLAGPSGLVLEVGSSQANAGLRLAEAGLTVLAVDLLPEALAYARAKYDYGPFLTAAGSAAALPVRSSSCDCVLLGELLEHCADPPAIVCEARRVLRPGGYLLVTTPNGRYGRHQLPLYRTGPVSRELVDRQFGAEGDDHLFAFTRASLRKLLRDAALKRVSVGLVGNAVFSNRLAWLKSRLPLPALRTLAGALNVLPLVGERTGLTLMAVAQKTGS